MLPDACGSRRRRPAADYPSAGLLASFKVVAAAAVLAAVTGCFQSFDSGPKPIITEGALADVVYEPARRLVSRSCADCHAKDGNNETHGDAWGHAIRLDAYAEWVDGRRVLLERLDPATALAQDPPVDTMPSAGFLYPLTLSERDTLLQWIKRGSPNTESGF
jgi:mono/diheme cytochrome c family protein